MKILITGGAGFIGSHLVDRLAAVPAHQVTVFDNFSRGRMENIALSNGRISVVRGDIRDRSALQEVMIGIDLVYHLAAQSSVLGAANDSDAAFEINVVGTYEVLRAASSAGVCRLVFSSSREVYGDPESIPVPESAPLKAKNAYGTSKAAAEIYCRLFARQGIEVLILRLANVYGPRDRDRVIPLFAENALSGKPLKVFGDNKILDFVWIDDVVDVLSQVSSTGPWPNQPINIGSGKGVLLTDLANRISAVTGGRVQIEITGERLPEVSRFVADITTAKCVFGINSPDDPLEHLPALIESMPHNQKDETAVS